MRILALETSTPHCSCALWQDGVVIERAELAGQRHSELVLPMVRSVLAEAGAALAGLDAVAFGAGPGSFTGVRIACSVAQGLAFGHDLPMVPVVTLAALADQESEDAVMACLDARMGELYLAAYRRDAAGLHCVLPPMLTGPARLPVLDGAWHGCGSGFTVAREALMGAFRVSSVRDDRFPMARGVARLAAVEVAAGRVCAPEDALPLYLRDKVALDVREQAAARAARVPA